MTRDKWKYICNENRWYIFRLLAKAPEKSRSYRVHYIRSTNTSTDSSLSPIRRFSLCYSLHSSTVPTHITTAPAMPLTGICCPFTVETDRMTHTGTPENHNDSSCFQWSPNHSPEEGTLLLAISPFSGATRDDASTRHMTRSGSHTLPVCILLTVRLAIHAKDLQRS